VARTLLVIHVAAYLATIIFNEIHVFGPLAFLVTFLCGVQDAALQTQITIVLGFEFRTNVEPFAIYRLLNSLAICFAMAAEAQLSSLSGYRLFFIFSFLVTLGAQAIMAFSFTFKNRVTSKDKEEAIPPVASCELEHLVSE
jgi:hypothetical protein